MFICRSRAAYALPPVVVTGVTIPYSSKVCDLGMTLSDRVTFDDHINDQCSTLLEKSQFCRILFCISCLKIRIFTEFQFIQQYLQNF
jgi:hypothetical protein